MTKYAAVRIEEAVGAHIRMLREDAGFTQKSLGEALAIYLGKPWPRQSVHQAERGQRKFTAEELVAFAAALECDIGHLFPTPGSSMRIALPACTIALTEFRHKPSGARLDLTDLLVKSERLAAAATEMAMAVKGIQIDAVTGRAN